VTSESRVLTRRFLLVKEVAMETTRHDGCKAIGRSAAVAGAISALVWAMVLSVRATGAGEPDPFELVFSNPAGVHRTVTMGGAIDTNNAFFQDLGTNGRTCFSCHRPAQAWTITPRELADRFVATDGLDPIFRANDGSNCEGADVSSIEARRQAFSLLLSKGLIRVGIQVPANAEFTIVDEDDPYDCNAALTGASMYRRPLPTTNLPFLSAVMWDGRETVKGHAVRADLLTQASSATTSHAQGASPSASQLEEIVDFELGLFTAQTHAHAAGNLSARGVRGGPGFLAREPFCIGINDPLDILPAMPGACAASSGGLNPTVFTLFADWLTASSPGRQSIARGEEIFNHRTFVIDNVAGLNGRPEDPVAGPLQAGTCTICHDTPNAGDHSIAMPLNIGIADASRRTPDLPLYTLLNRATGETIQTSDPGRAMVTGRWSDIGKFKGPILRALAPRAPYFHNGSAGTLEEAVDFYNERFNIGLTPQEKADLVAFLNAL
jgi:cytochrome c peroxidase